MILELQMPQAGVRVFYNGWLKNENDDIWQITFFSGLQGQVVLRTDIPFYPNNIYFLSFFHNPELRN